ncbi:MAG: hypothetical protein KJ011_06555 [Burkholderiaceae bacterium]|nr:hypothetical protein [Burkholderiaceae bacterium]
MLPADVKPLTAPQLEDLRQRCLRTGDAALRFWFYVNVELQLGLDALADPHDRASAEQRMPGRIEEWRAARAAVQGSKYI